jgi:hypothetical protein
MEQAATPRETGLSERSLALRELRSRLGTEPRPKGAVRVGIRRQVSQVSQEPGLRASKAFDQLQVLLHFSPVAPNGVQLFLDDQRQLVFAVDGARLA